METGLSFEMFKNQWIVTSKYAPRYLKNPAAIPVESIRAKWLESLGEIAKEGPLSEKAIDSFISEYGEIALLQTFRGIYSKGLISYVPKDKTNAHCQNPAMF